MTVTEPLFETAIKQLGQREERLNNNIDDSKISKMIRQEVRNGSLGIHSYSGHLTDRLSNYLFDSRNTSSYRTNEYSFYASEGNYWSRKIPHSMRLTDDIEELVRVNNYYREVNEDRDGYLNRLFDPAKLTENDFKNFIRCGLVDANNDAYLTNDDMLKAKLLTLRQIVIDSCLSMSDLVFLKFFDGKRNQNEIAKIMDIRHQNVSKRLKKICKNCRKRVQSLKLQPSIR